ncbi:unnamed protein product [Acanthoscelides obtectus]|uniref:Uncharacterized protein n=1 Tax=Acanthoscelides obtectus TaxID=200917 RepID=A0A9P0MC34_ACAOB|nr:unnamed protein product [Acanthoscelides obtectus]CAK1659518.1 Phytanoyl-CoA dioxygenase domain-containing protein 1 homolog [Acanthoscelides obtectus]
MHFQNKDRYFLESGDKISYFYEQGAIGPNGELLVEPHLSLNKIGHALHELDPVFRKMTFSEQVKEVAFQLGYEEPAVVQSMYIFKKPWDWLRSNSASRRDLSVYRTRESDGILDSIRRCYSGKRMPMVCRWVA